MLIVMNGLMDESGCTNGVIARRPEWVGCRMFSTVVAVTNPAYIISNPRSLLTIYLTTLSLMSFNFQAV